MRKKSIKAKLKEFFIGEDIESPPLEKKYQLVLDKLNKIGYNETLLIVVDDLGKTSKFVKDLTPHLKSPVFFGNEQRIYFPLFSKGIKFVTLDTIFTLGIMFFTDEDVSMFGGRGQAITKVKDVNPLIVLDLEDFPMNEFGEFMNTEDAMFTFELLRKKREAKGRGPSYTKSVEMPPSLVETLGRVRGNLKGENRIINRTFIKNNRT